MRLTSVAAFTLAALVSASSAGTLSSRATSCKTDNDCPGITCCNLSTLKCVSDPNGTICDIPPKTTKTTTTKKATTTTKKATTTTKKATTTTATKKTTTAATTKKATTTTKTTTTATATPSYGPLHPSPMNPKPTCRSYTENFNSPVIIEADDWKPTSTSVDMVNISGSPDAYSVKDGILTLRMMQPTFDKGGKPTTEGVAATIDMAFEMQYGNVEIRVKANSVSGAVSTFNTMSASGDEIDIEISPNFFQSYPPTYFESNYFSKGQMYGPNGKDHEYYPNLGFNVSADYHIYRIEWYPDHLTWTVDGKLLRTLNKVDTFDGTKYLYPMEVSRLELGIWDAGYANSGWGGGPINWHNYKELDAQFDYIKIECNPEYNNVIGPRTSTSAKSLASVDNSGIDKPDIGEVLPNGVVIGHHASPGTSKGK